MTRTNPTTPEPKQKTSPLETIFATAALAGIIGFIGGFFGPVILYPDANQGPLTGIFITGPLGFVIGIVIGIIRVLVAKFKNKK